MPRPVCGRHLYHLSWLLYSWQPAPESEVENRNGLVPSILQPPFERLWPLTASASRPVRLHSSR